MKHKFSKSQLWILPLGSVLLLFGFFQLLLPYTLYHREQYSLFLMNELTVKQYFHQDAPLSRLVGDYLTQFYYYVGAGPFILALVLTALGMLAYAFFRNLKANRWVSGFVAIVVVLWETGRECIADYPLSSTLSIIGIAALLLGIVKLCKKKWLGSIWVLISLLFISIHPVNKNGWGMPDQDLEKMFAMDSEAYFGNWTRVLELTEKDEKNEIATYYHNLALAMKGEMPNQLMHYYQPFERGLFIPVNDKGNYFKFTAAGEAWFQMGATTLAEHASMLGMIFSPKQMGNRCLKRLAEINLLTGDSVAAQKYLRLLKQTPVHKKWALDRCNPQSPAYQELMKKRQLMANTDIIHGVSNYPANLRNLLDSNARNYLARDYLLCYDLLTKNLNAFVSDYTKYGANVVNDLYAQALLIASAIDPTQVESVEVSLPQQILADFRDYNQIMGGDMGTVQKKYGQTYWFYYQYAKRNEK